MTRRPFNLSFLRRGAIRTPPATSTGVTRREAIAGVAAAAVVPRFFSSFAGTPGVVGVTASPGRAALTQTTASGASTLYGRAERLVYAETLPLTPPALQI